MKKNKFRRKSVIFAILLTFMVVLTACGQSDEEAPLNNGAAGTKQTPSSESEITITDRESSVTDETTSVQGEKAATELIVRFGDDGAPFIMHLYDNDTAAAIADYVGTTEWRLPIYHYDDYENWEVMQYYDIPSRYEIPSNPEEITSEAAGMVYYSEPNRIVLYYGDAEISAEYTPIGYFDVTDEFVSAVEDNPVLEGWGNKIVHISDSE